MENIKPSPEAPMRLEDVLVIAKDDTTVKFNFRRETKQESWEGAAGTFAIFAEGSEACRSHSE